MPKLMRTTYGTDYNADEPEYPGNFSDQFPLRPEWQIADVDWSEPGEVTITFVIP